MVNIEVNVVDETITCDPEPCDIRDEKPNCPIHWELGRTTRLAWKFADGNGISFNDDPNGEFYDFRHQDSDRYHCKSKNVVTRDFKYTVRLISTRVNDAGKVLELDPTIKNGSGKED